MNLPVIGVDFYSHAGEINGEVPPDWRVFHAHLTSPWSCANIGMRWSHIGHAAYKRKDGKLWDLASLISHQIRVSSWRLRQISEAYHEQLMARINGGKFSEGQMFEDGFTWLAYLSIQSFLVDACVLRDYLAEFAAHYIYGPQAGSKKVNVTSMSGLIKQFLDKVSNPCDPITVCLKAATTDGGWLKELGSFRDLIVHAAPLAKARQRLFATAVTLKIGQTSALLAIRCPIPDNPQTIKDGRATGDHFKDFTDQFNNFAGAAKGDVPNRDGLNYAHQILGN